MREIKYKKPFWCVVFAFSCAAILASLAFLSYYLLRDGFRLLWDASLLCAAACGVAMALHAFRALRCLRGVCSQDEVSTAPKKQREQLSNQQNDIRCFANRSFAKSLAAFILLISAVIFLLFYAEAQATPKVAQSTVVSGIIYQKAVVVSVDKSEYRGQQDVENIPIGSQTVTVKITSSGKYKGKQLQLKNNIAYLYGTVLSVNDPVTISFSLKDGAIEHAVLEDYDRTIPLFIVVAAFLIITILVGGKVGAKSLLGLGFTILCVFAIMIPLLLGGAPTLPTVFWICAYVTVVEFVILDGVNKKTVCAILGTISGVLFAELFGRVACWMMRVNGFQMYITEPTIEVLLQIKQGQDPLSSLQIGDLLVGGILIAALGAVNDVAMSISSSMNELMAVNPNLTRKKLFRSGMNIGHDMVGTMTNTLILALVGSGLVMMIYLYSLEPSFTQMMSTAFLSVEMVQMLASSVGVILAVPMSVLIGTFLFGHGKHHSKSLTKS